MAEEVPLWLKERLARYEQLQQNLQSILLQKQQIELETAEAQRAIEELKASPKEAVVYKLVGPILVKVEKEKMIEELEERLGVNKTRSILLARQEERIRKSLVELQEKLTKAPEETKE